MTDERSVADRRAIEALRAGVPNGDAVRRLGSGQTEILAAFDEKLAGAASFKALAPTGFVISGGFGSGKSHLIEELHQRALAANYVSSKVSISKETPLHLPTKVVQSAVRSMQAETIPEGLLLEMALRLQTDRPSYQDFAKWCGTRPSGISLTFRSLLDLRANSGQDLDVIDLLVRYWSSEVVLIWELRSALRSAGLADSSVEAVRAADRPWQTVRFLARLCQVHGYRGWAIFLDEVELISNYGFVSRARAYGQLGRWLGLQPGHRVPGTAVVATIINDFIPQVLDEKGDRRNVGPLLEQGRSESDLRAVPLAEGAMRALDDALFLKDTDLQHLRSAQRILREAHSRAYRWAAPELDVQLKPDQPMRLYVRRWINEWDLRRLYPGEHLDFRGEDITIDYQDDPDIELSDDG